MSLAGVLEVADAVLYEGYLLYPYRSTSAKNQARWQFGVLGPPGAAEAGMGEEAAMHTECLLRPGPSAAVTVHVRFLQLCARSVEQADPAQLNGYLPVDELRVGDQSLVSWDEATECHIELGPFPSAALVGDGVEMPIEVAGAETVEDVAADGAIAARVVRRRWTLRAVIRISAVAVAHDTIRLVIDVANATEPVSQRLEATRLSLLGAHLVLQAADATFVSLLDPPADLQAAARECQNLRCWPVMAGEEGTTDTVLVSPIILYDYPAVAPESPGALFDSTEIDEILTLRVMTLTDQEKSEARATDPAAAAIIDRCEQMTAEDLQALHGVLRDAHHPDPSPTPATGPDGVPSFFTPTDDDRGEAMPWWDPGVDAEVSPTSDVVMVEGVPVANGSAVILHPRRQADAQDLFFADQRATVTAVFSDVDGGTHVAVVLDDDPAADLHRWYGRYLYFAPDELEPIDPGRATTVSQPTPDIDLLAIDNEESS